MGSGDLFMMSMQTPWFVKYRTYKRRKTMKLSKPTGGIFLISLIIAALAVVSLFVNIPFVSDNTFYTLLLGYVILFLGNIIKGL